MKMSVINPLFQLGLMEEMEKKQRNTSTHSNPRQGNTMPRDMSFDLSLMTFEDEEQEIFPENTEESNDGWLQKEEDKVDCAQLHSVHATLGASTISDYMAMGCVRDVVCFVGDRLIELSSIPSLGKRCHSTMKNCRCLECQVMTNSRTMKGEWMHCAAVDRLVCGMQHAHSGFGCLTNQPMSDVVTIATEI